MMWGGYTPKVREVVARRVLAKYTTNLWNLREQGRPIYRSKQQRNLMTKPDKSDWFLKEGVIATLTVPFTQGSQLAKDIRQALIGTGPKGTKVKVIECPGPKLMSELVKNNPFLRKSCDRENCPCVTKGMFCNEKCYKEGIIYKASCDRCYQSDVENNREPIQK